MGLFTTRQLLGYTEQKVKFRALFLELFFRRTITFHTQEVMLDKITGKTPVAAYVSPVVSGKVLRSRGGETRVLRPGYVKPKHRFDYQQAVERLPGEDPARLNDPAYRRLRILTDNLKQEEQAIVQVEEMQAVSAVLQGKYTMSGEQFETVEVDFGRSAANNITQAGGREWSKQNADTFDPTHDLDAYCDFASGTINIAIMDGTVWRMLNGFKLFREKLDNRLCTSHSQWRFEPVRRTADVIEDSIQEAMLSYVDRPLDRDVADDILGSINAYMRQLKNLGAIHGGSAWLNDELNTAETLAAGQLYIDYDFGPKSPLERLTLRAMINNKLALEELTV